MSPAELVEWAAGDGVLIALLPSGSISATGVQSAVDRWLPAIRQNKAAIIRLLRPGEDGWSTQDWRAFFGERAGIAEFDGGLSRVEAEASAFTRCVAQWLNRNPMRSPPGRCFGCAEPESPHNPSYPSASEPPAKFGCIRVATPFGTPGGRARRLPHWPRWGSERRQTE